MKILSFLVLLACTLNAEDDLKNKLEVGVMSFDGNKMLLSGDFKWEHSLGNISAKSAEACFDYGESSLLPHEISMQEGVSITMKDGESSLLPMPGLDAGSGLVFSMDMKVKRSLI